MAFTTINDLKYLAHLQSKVCSVRIGKSQTPKDFAVCHKRRITMNKYIAPELEIIRFESEDVITASDIEYTTAENESSIH